MHGYDLWFFLTEKIKTIENNLLATAIVNAIFMHVKCELFSVMEKRGK